MEQQKRREIYDNHFGDNNTIFQGDVVHNHWPKDQEDEKAQCLSDLRITDPRHDKLRIEATKGGLLEDSYSWIFEHNDYQQWHHNKDRPLLWIKGDPGKGKTMLLCGIINKLRSQRSPKTLVTYFFCRADDSRINSATAVLRGLVYLAIDEQPQLISHIQNKYRHGKKSMFEDINAWTALSEIFSAILNDTSLEQSYVIIDALDECTENLRNLLEYINTTSTMFSRVKWIVSSRNWSEIEESLNSSASQQTRLCLELNDKSITAAVDIYIKHQVERLKDRKSITEDVQRTLLYELSTKSNNTFLWVSLVCQNLEKTSSLDILESLKRFPSGLDSVYQRMIKQINDIDDINDAKYCFQTLGIVLLVYRPVTLVELGCLFKRDDGNPATAEFIFNTIALCGSFLTIREGKVYIIHQSAKDYLNDAESPDFQLSFANIHKIIFEQSINTMSAVLKRNIYNLDPIGLSISQIKRPDPDPLQSIHYSCVHWANHLCDLYRSNTYLRYEKHKEQYEIALKFLLKHSLYWFEALGLIECTADGVMSIINLESLLKEMSAHNLPTKSTPEKESSWTYEKLKGVIKGTSHSYLSPSRRLSSRKSSSRQLPNFQLLELVQDVRRFIQQNNSIIAYNPLQVYASALIFSPSNSLMRGLFAREEPKWLKLKPNVDDNWTSCLQTLGGHEESVSSVAFSAKGFLASASWDGTIKIWDAITGRERYTFKHIGSSAFLVTFSADGRYLAAGLGNIMTTIWDAVTGKELQTTRYSEYFTSIALSADGRYLAVGSADQTMRIWDVFSNKEQQILQGHWARINSVAFSTSNYLASGSYDKTIRIWDLTGKGHQILKGHTSPVRSISFSADGRYLTSGSDESVKIWDTITGKELRTIKIDTINTWSHTFSTNGQYFAFAKGHTIRIWNMKTGKEHQKFQGRNTFLSIAFSANGDYLVSGQDDHSVCIWEVAVSKEGQTSLAQKTRSIALSTDGDYLASGGDDSVIRIWNTATGKEHQTLKGHNKSVTLVAFSANGRYIASTSLDCTIKIWDAVTGKRKQSTKAVYPDTDSSLVFSSNGSYLAFNELSTRIAIWDVNAGKIYRKIKENCDHLNLFVFSADARYLAFADDGTSHTPRHLSESDKIPIRIWDIEADKELCVFPGHSNWVTSIAFSPGNRYLASGSMDGTIKIWDAKQGAELATIKKETLIRTMLFDPKASYLLTETESLYLNLEHQPSLTSPAANSAKGRSENRLIAGNTQNKNGTGYGISLDTCWVTWNGLGILWLPPEYRSTRPIIRLLSASASSQLPMADVLIALRSRSGRFVMMRMSGSGPYST